MKFIFFFTSKRNLFFALNSFKIFDRLSSVEGSKFLVVIEVASGRNARI